MILDSNQNVRRNPWAEGKVPLRFNVLIVRSELDFLCVGVCLCMCILGDGAVACVCINCRSWWVRTRTEREWWLTSQLMTNPYPACNSTPAVRFLHVHMHTLTQTHTRARTRSHMLTHASSHIHTFISEKRSKGNFASLGDIKSREEWLHFHSSVTCSVFGSHMAASCFHGADGPANLPKCIHSVCVSILGAMNISLAGLFQTHVLRKDTGNRCKSEMSRKSSPYATVSVKP